MSNETNDPKAPYGEKREPMLPDRMIEVSQPSHLCAGLLSARQYYEDLITKGDLIRKDELTKWLESQIDPGETAWNAAIESVKAHIEG